MPSRATTGATLLRWAAIAGLGAALAAQDGAPVFRSGVREVQVHVVVKDRQGRAVAGLDASDFRLLDQGKPQRITHFSVHSRHSRAGLPQAASALPAGAFSNRLVFKQDVPRGVTAILIDAYNSRFEDQHYAVRDTIRVLREMPLDERVAVYRLERAGVAVLHDYTADTASLIQRLENAGSLASFPSELSETTAPSQRPTELKENSEALKLEARVRLLQTLGAMRAIAAHLRQLPGRKGLVWLTAGFPMEIVTDNPAVWRRAMREINDANVAIYSIDSSGMRLLAGYSASIPTGRSLPSPRSGRANANNDVLKEAASRTGGAAYENGNDLSKALRQSLDDAEVVYTLGYAPDHERWDGKFRRIRVNVDRKNVRLRYREGYFADLARDYDVKDRNEALDIALLSPLEASGVGLTVQFENNPDGDGDRAEITLVGDPQSLVLEHREGRWIGGFDVRFVQRTAEGRELDAFTNEITLNMEQERYERMRQEGFVVNETVAILPETAELRIAVCDHLSDALGSVFIPIRASR